ncbi:calcium-binding protein [Calothrix sp. PCC 7507]|uniref:calcium-binding protein n=1 Tax=Calothrix sp. PCC 7507 TaxID=99598 RepID=UPI00029F1195|nr:calcium-binding protein [Calothrix sp. PCC 7507]AFY35187.1 Hemolysin-type calcium-binding region [Calothrix sp. PCC 7507]
MNNINVNFNLTDYAELGDIKKAVSSSEAELNKLDINASASIDYLNIFFASLSSANTVANNKYISVITLLGDLQNILGVTTAKEIQDLSTVFSPINTSDVTQGLNNLENVLKEYSSKIGKPIELPTLADYYAILVSGSARRDAQDLQSRVKNAQNKIGNSLTLVDNSLSAIKAYSANLDKASRLLESTTKKVFEFLAIPGINLFLKDFAVLLVAFQGELNSLKQEVSETTTQLDKTRSNIIQTQQNLTDLNNSLDSALGLPTVSSDWITYDNLPEDARFKLTFEGRIFTHPYAEIEGPFEVGKLWIKNNISFVGTNVIANPILSFSVQRNIDDPIFGPQSTDGTAKVFSTYLATTNTNNPQQSADYFTIPKLGIKINIYEEATYGPLKVIGSYNSPLEIVAIVPEKGATGGFITSIDGSINNNSPIAIDDFFSTDEHFVLSENILTSDADIELDLMTVTAVNGNAANVGTEITLDSGALLTLNSDGTFDYDPNGQFESLSKGTSATDSFDYTVSDSYGATDIASVTVTINGAEIPDGAIVGTRDAETIFGNASNDIIYALGGNDQIFASEGNNTIFGGTGDDLIYGGSQADTIYGEKGNDTIFANEGVNTVFGGAGDDLIYTGSGNDFISGGVGNDTIWLGGGRDIVVLAKGDGIDTVNNFQVGQTMIGLSGGLTYDDLTIIQGNGSALINTGDKLLASLSWVQASNIKFDSFFTI